MGKHEQRKLRQKFDEASTAHTQEMEKQRRDYDAKFEEMKQELFGQFKVTLAASKVSSFCLKMYEFQLMLLFAARDRTGAGAYAEREKFRGS